MAAVTKIQRYLLESNVLSVADTTDVSVFADAARANGVVPLPTSCIFKFVALHAVFNQQELWEAFIDEGIVSYSDRSIKEAGIPSLLRRFKRNGKIARSSNIGRFTCSKFQPIGGELGEMRRLLRPYGTHCLRKSLWSVFPTPLGMSLTLSPAGRPGR